MADSMFMFGVTTGVFIILVAILFASRAHRRHRSEEDDVESKLDTSSSGSSVGGRRRIKKFKSDGTPVND